MNATTDILRGELERLFELEDMMQLSSDLLGYEPDLVGGTAGKGAFARALVEHCAGEDALEALVDAILLSEKGKSAKASVQKALLGVTGSELSPGTELGDYRVSKKIGAGNYGIVYLGERNDGGVGDPRRVAIKVISPKHSRDRAAARRFMTVSRALRSVGTDGLAAVAAVGQLDDGRPWVATTFVEGQTLAARISRVGPMHINEARTILESVLDTLAVLHKRGIVHGDVKAENVFMVRPTAEDGSRGEPIGVLVDGGVDRLVARGNGLLSVSGTVKAVDPQLARGQAPGSASDLYAAAVLLYEVLCGRPPFIGDSAIDVVAQHLSAEPEPPSVHAPRGWVSKEVDELVLKALSKDPLQRYASAAAFSKALDTIGRAQKRSDQKKNLDEKAFDAAVSALQAKPEDDELALALERIVEPAHEWKRAVDVLVETAESVEDSSGKKALLFRAARMQASELEDSEAAEALYRKVIELDPEDHVARAGIEELKRASGASDELVEVLLEKAETVQMHAERASILREIAQIYEDDLGQEENGFVAWVQALADEPTDDRTIREVERLAETPERWNEAIATLSETAQELDPLDSVPLYLLMGRWYSDHLSRPDFALQCFSQALAADPTNEAAYTGTIQLYRKSQSWQELVTVLLRRADTTQNPARARDYRADAAEVIHTKLNDPSRAGDLFRQILEADPAHPRAAGALEKVLSERKEWKELVSLLELRSHNERGEARVATLVRMGELFEDRLDDLEQSAVHYQGALSHDAHSVDALKGLERVFARTGRYKELLENLETQMEVAATPRQKISLLERIGGILEEEFVDHERAADAYARIVEMEPGHDGANAALARLYRSLQRFDDLALTLERHARGTEDRQRRMDLLITAVRVLMVDVGAPERAMEVCRRVLDVEPEHNEALELMARLQTSSGDAAAATEAVDRLAESEKDVEKRVGLWLRAGRLLEDRGDKDGAIERYKRALDDDPKNTEAASLLRSVYASRGDAHGAVELLQKELEMTDGAISKAKLYAEMGDLYCERLDETTRAKDAYEKALDLDPTCTPASTGMSRLAFAAEDYHSAARHSEPLLNRVSEMPSSVARDISLLCGDAFTKLEEFAKAQRAYLNAMAFAPDDLEVLERVADVTFESGAPDEAVELYRDIKDRFADQLVGAERGRILYRLGDSMRRAGDLVDSIAVLTEAADLLREEPEPLASLVKVHEEKGDWAKVIATLRRRMEHAEDPERFELLVTEGDVLLDRLGDRPKAAKTYVSALDLKPDDRNLLTKLMGVYSESKDWSRLVEVILRIAELVDEPKQLSKYYNTAAAIAHRELGRLEEACDYYEQALENDPGLSNAFKGLTECLAQKGDAEALADAHRSQIERSGDAMAPEKRAQLFDALGDVLADQLARPEEAVEAYEQAQDLESDNRRRTEKLTEIYESDRKRYFSRAVKAHRLLLQSNAYRAESYQALSKLYQEMGKLDESWCVAQALKALGMAEPTDIGFFREHRSRTPAAAQEFFSEEIWFNHILHADQDPLLTGIFATITPAVIVTRAQPLQTFGIGPSDRKDAENDPAAMAQTLHYVAGVTQIPLPPVYYRENDPGGLSVLSTDPPGIGLGIGALAGGPSQALAFVAGRHLSYYRPGLYLRHLVPTGSGLRAWLLAAIKMVQPQFPVPANLAGPVGEHLISLKQHVTGKQLDELTSLVQKLLDASPSLDMKKWVAAVDLTADRTGFVLANDLEVSAAVIKASPEDAASVGQKDRLRELYLYSVSKEYLQLRQRLGISIG